MSSWFEHGNIYSPVAITQPSMQKGYQLHPSYRKRVANVLRDSVGIPTNQVQSMVNDIMTDSVVNKGRSDMWSYLTLASFFIVGWEIKGLQWMLKYVPNSVKWDLAKRSQHVFEPLIESKLQQKMQHYGSGVKRQPRNQSWQYEGAKYQSGTKVYKSKFKDTNVSAKRRSLGQTAQAISASRLPTKWEIQNLMYDLVDLYEPQYLIDQPYQPKRTKFWFDKRRRR